MKRILIIMLCVMGMATLHAQTEVKDGYVESNQGFVIKKGTFEYEGRKYGYHGLYSADGKVLVQCIPYKGGVAYGCTVAPGTEVIVNAAHGEGYITAAPSSVRKICEGAKFNSNKLVVYDVTKVTKHKEEFDD
jgi:hypothetical protein